MAEMLKIDAEYGHADQEFAALWQLLEAIKIVKRWHTALRTARAVRPMAALAVHLVIEVCLLRIERQPRSSLIIDLSCRDLGVRTHLR